MYENREPFMGDVKYNITKETMAAGPRHSVALKTDGRVEAVGDNRNGQCNVRE